jgi:hypothetical protein
MHRAGIHPAQRAVGSVLGRPLHATAIEVDEHLHRCLVYIDLKHGVRRYSQSPR